ncbi:hypothetical protein BDW02DRAFT_579146 [Decorospora gaudefroyi]|uniref:Zn(2)-C6 fungal-type domain-containing protein n=1 Tax=Decorospora gaudefroyi TaxID=184978 RepID=A0A6A5KAN7_9PLEO|nr:hypothetical protein BDW02DRAFT_579146 [Decorospora gaudefroyi]
MAFLGGPSGWNSSSAEQRTKPYGAVPVLCLLANGNRTRRENQGDGLGFGQLKWDCEGRQKQQQGARITGAVNEASQSADEYRGSSERHWWAMAELRGRFLGRKVCMREAPPQRACACVGDGPVGQPWSVSRWLRGALHGTPVIGRCAERGKPGALQQSRRACWMLEAGCGVPAATSCYAIRAYLSSPDFGAFDANMGRRHFFAKKTWARLRTADRDGAWDHGKSICAPEQQQQERTAALGESCCSSAGIWRRVAPPTFVSRHIQPSRRPGRCSCGFAGFVGFVVVVALYALTQVHQPLPVAYLHHPAAPPPGSSASSTGPSRPPSRSTGLRALGRGKSVVPSASPSSSAPSRTQEYKRESRPLHCGTRLYQPHRGRARRAWKGAPVSPPRPAMSAVLHMPAFNAAPHGPAFTSVNGRSSLSPTDDQKPSVAAKSSTWSPVSRGPENSYHSPSSDTSASTVTSGDGSPASPNKRRRSVSEENDHPQCSSDGASAELRVLPRPFQPMSMEAPLQRSLPPLVSERRWATEPRELPHNGFQNFQPREPRPSELVHDARSSATHARESPEMEDSNATEVTRAGVQVELKKRKRQFANRTKTGCGTCRRRKKKCDEAKPECNNCTRGGFICEGYANKIPWPKNGATKLQAPLHPKERPAIDVPIAYGDRVHLPHHEAPRSTETSYPPLETHPSNAPERKHWNGWTESTAPPPPPPPPVRASYSSEAPPPALAQYSRHSTIHPERPPTRDHQTMPHHQSPPHQHSSRVYHHTPQSMSHLVAGTPASTSAPSPAMAALVQHHQASQHHSRPPPPPPIVTPSGQSPTRYAQTAAPVHKSEKDKMLAGEPFRPFDRGLMDERRNCAGAVNQFNSTANASNQLVDQTRGYHFKTILAARWVRPPEGADPIISHLGNDVNVAAPFFCDYGYHLNIGDNVVIGSDCHLHDSARICIGRNTKIGVRVTIQTLKTPTDNKSLKGYKGTEVAQEVYIGENVYIGDGCVIEAGVRIGENTIVRPGSVVSRNLPSNCAAHGNPAIILPN